MNGQKRTLNRATHEQVRGGAYVEASNLVAAEIGRHRVKLDYYRANRNPDFEAREAAAIEALADVQILIAARAAA